jgi:hypothetical protein
MIAHAEDAETLIGHGAAAGFELARIGVLR